MERRPSVPSPPGEDGVAVEGAGVLVGHEVVEEGVGADEAPLEVVVVVGIRGCNLAIYYVREDLHMTYSTQLEERGRCVNIQERVSNFLWTSFVNCPSMVNKESFISASVIKSATALWHSNIVFD